ncbi:MAG: U32 family peptidase [Clostridia bacterium]|nr:U32 family peptidase [Clostridia bacterium]
MEILAPAGNMEALIAAVRCGADAVYLGLKDFSARRNADNFDREALKKAIEYCHIRGVKVYIAINTMIKESELSLAVDEAAFAYNCGADAFIVSDLGLISVLHKKLPEAVLHASTQMTVHSPAAIPALKNYGIKRVVLAREMSREEIKVFCTQAKKEDIEVEVFVHGALCMCVSGQCLLSSVLGGRSGNRGLCAGPCRLEFSAKNTGRYDLSLKDLSLIDYLLELESFGITSAKIEGRMKRPEYVAAAVLACRASLDGDKNTQLKKALADVFSRSGFTDGYYKSSLCADMFGVRTKEDVLESGTAFSFIHTLYRSERQSVPVDITAEIEREKQISITVKCGKDTVTVNGNIPQEAIKNSVTEDGIKQSLSKLGGTPYFVKSVTVTLDGGLFVSAGELNALRREAVEMLNAVRGGTNRNAVADYLPEKAVPDLTKEPETYIKINGAEQLPSGISGVAGVILPLECDFTALPDGIEIIADLPRYIADENKLIKRLNEVKNQGVNKAYCGNLSAVALAETRASGLSVQTVLTVQTARV